MVPERFPRRPAQVLGYARPTRRAPLASVVVLPLLAVAGADVGVAACCDDVLGPAACPAVTVRLVRGREGALLGCFRAAPFPAERTVIAVRSLGGPASTAGVALHGWATAVRSGFATGFLPRSGRAPSTDAAGQARRR